MAQEDWMAPKDNFESKIPMPELKVLLELGNELEFELDPISSDELEEYFLKLLGTYKGPLQELPQWLRPRLKTDFRCLQTLPVWIQGSDWQVCDGRPMIFVGQVDVPPTEGVFHDDASFYLFFDPISGVSKSVLQVA